MIRRLLLAAVVMGSGVANMVNAAPISWLSTQLAADTNDAAIAVLRLLGRGDSPWTQWNRMDVSNRFDFTALDRMIAIQHACGIQNVILKISGFPPADVDSPARWLISSPSNYVTRISRFVWALGEYTTTAKSGLWILPDNEPEHTWDGFRRHAAILKACWSASHGRLKIVGCALQDRRPQAFRELAALGCTNWCDAVSFHYYDSWEMAPDLPRLGSGARDTVYNDVRAIATIFPGKPIFCDEFGVALNIDRTRKAILMMLAAGVQMIEPWDWSGDMTHPGDDVARLHGDEPYAFYQCWDYTSNRPAPYAKCVVDLADQIGSNPKATLSRTPNGKYLIKVSNGAAYAWNTNGLGPIDYYVIPSP